MFDFLDETKNVCTCMQTSFELITYPLTIKPKKRVGDYSVQPFQKSD